MQSFSLLPILSGKISLLALFSKFYDHFKGFEGVFQLFFLIFTLPNYLLFNFFLYHFYCDRHFNQVCFLYEQSSMATFYHQFLQAMNYFLLMEW